jgi:long-chain acyl-CoA synthetase
MAAHPGLQGDARSKIADAYDKTFPQMLRIRAEASPTRVGLRERHRGIWREWTWQEIWEECGAIGEALLDLDLSGKHVAFIGDPCIESLLVTIACQGVGAVPFGIYPTTAPGGVRFLLEDADAACVICEDQEFVDKVVDSGSGEGRDLVVIDTKGMFASQYASIPHWDDVVRKGHERRAAGSRRWEEGVDAGAADDVAGIYYTSGTTGDPKGAVLSHRIITHGWLCPFYEDMLPGLGAEDRSFNEVPGATLAGPLMGIYFPLVFGLTGYIPDRNEPIETAMVEASPTLYLGFPRQWETRASRTLIEIETSSFLHRTAFRAGMALRRFAAGGRNPLRRLAGALGYLTTVRPMLDQWGLLSGRFVLSGGAPLSPDLVKLWRLWGLTIREVYGSTECGGLMTIQADAVPTPGVAGRAIPGCEIKIAEDGEILAKGPNLFLRYWNRDEESREAFDEDGWLKTGDLGRLREDGNLEVIDRKKDVVIMAGGTMVPASSIEHVLKFSPYVRDALLIGEGRPTLGALIEIDQEAVSQWARVNNVAYTGFTNLAENEEVVGLIGEEIEKANATLAERESLTVSDYRILPKELDPEDPTEITATRKIRRRQLADKFTDLVDSMYMTDESRRIMTHARGSALETSTDSGGDV